MSGLSSMSENVSYSTNLKIVRPFLGFKKTDLKYVTLNIFKTYIKDPSNNNEKFLRIRIRKYRKNMEQEGLDTKKIIKTVSNLLSANKALNFYKNKALYKHATFVSKNKCLINKQIFLDEAGEIVFKSISDILSLISGTYYPPRSKKVVSLIERLKKNKFTKSTLGGCIIEEKDNIFTYLAQAGLSVLILNVVMMTLAFYIAKNFTTGIAQRKCISLECGLQNGTLAVFVTTQLFDDIIFMVPTAAYALVMFCTSIIFVLIVRKIN